MIGIKTVFQYENKVLYHKALSELNEGKYRSADIDFKRLKGMSSNLASNTCNNIATAFSALSEAANKLNIVYAREVLNENDKLQFKEKYLSSLEISKTTAEKIIGGQEHRLDEFNNTYNAIYKKFFE